VEVIGGICYRQNHRGIHNVSSVRWRDRFTDGNADGLTEGFKTSVLYGDSTDSPMKLPTDSKRQHRTVTCPFCRQISRRSHKQKYSSVKPSKKVNISPPTWLYPPLFLLLLPHLNSPQLQITSATPPKKISLFSTQQVIYLEVFLSQHPCSNLPTDFYQFL
jgi:hypothetical protein